MEIGYKTRVRNMDVTTDPKGHYVNLHVRGSGQITTISMTRRAAEELRVELAKLLCGPEDNTVYIETRETDTPEELQHMMNGGSIDAITRELLPRK